MGDWVWYPNSLKWPLDCILSNLPLWWLQLYIGATRRADCPNIMNATDLLSECHSIIVPNTAEAAQQSPTTHVHARWSQLPQIISQ
jgi:hypothetical protein